MKVLRNILLIIVIIAIAYIVGGNLYMQQQVKRSFHAHLRQFEERINERLGPGRGIKITVKELKPAFSLIPLLSTSNPFELKGMDLALPNGSLTIQCLRGTAYARVGKVERLKVAEIEGVEAKGRKGIFYAKADRATFYPPFDVSILQGAPPPKEVQAHAQGIALRINSPKLGRISLSSQELSFHQKGSLTTGEIRGSLEEEPLWSTLYAKGTLLQYAQEKGPITYKGSLFFDSLDMDAGLKKREGGFAFHEDVGLHLTKLQIAPLKKTLHPNALLPMKGNLNLELSKIPPTLVSTTIETFTLLRSGNMPPGKRLVMLLGFLQKAIIQLQGSLFEGKITIGFPRESGISMDMKVPMAQLMQKKGPPSAKLVVTKKEKLLDVFARAGIPSEKIAAIFEGMSCQGERCEKIIPLGRPSEHKAPDTK